jgi:protein-tyrosine-phosphatase
MATVLFVCLHNAGRSQMSQALFERIAGDRHTAISAGTTPAEHVHPEVVEVMRELDIDLAKRKPLHPRQAIRRLGSTRPEGTADRGGPCDAR